MKSYMKPTISLAMIGSDAGSYSSCIVKADMDLIQSIIGIEIPSNAFSLNEPCGTQLPIEMYCKFTSAELGAAQAFIS